MPKCINHAAGVDIDISIVITSNSTRYTYNIDAGYMVAEFGTTNSGINETGVVGEYVQERIGITGTSLSLTLGYKTSSLGLVLDIGSKQEDLGISATTVIF